MNAEDTSHHITSDHFVDANKMVPTDAPKGEGWRPGDQVEKYTGDYQLSGEVRATFTTKAGKRRYVVEHAPGFLHIYSDANLRPSPLYQRMSGGEGLRCVRVNDLADILGALPPAPFERDGKTHRFEDPKAVDKLYHIRDKFLAMLASATPADAPKGDVHAALELLATGEPAGAGTKPMPYKEWVRAVARNALSSRAPQAGGEGRLEQKIALLKKNWLKVAEQALAGDLGPLRTRVDLAKTTEWELEQQAASPCPDALRKALEPFAEAATTFEREYGHLMKPDTGCNIKFSALVAAREALAASPTPADASKGDVRAALETMRAYARLNAEAAPNADDVRVWRAFERKCVAALSALQAEAAAAIRSQP